MRPAIPEYLSVLLSNGPTIAVYLVGILIALAKWSRYPGPSALAFFGSLALLASRLVFTSLFFWLPGVMRQRGWAASQVHGLYTVLGTGQSLLSAVGVGLLLMAVYRSREPATGSAQGFPIRMSDASGYGKPPMPPPYR